MQDASKQKQTGIDLSHKSRLSSGFFSSVFATFLTILHQFQILVWSILMSTLFFAIQFWFGKADLNLPALPSRP
jgi:hypothetical protein